MKSYLPFLALVVLFTSCTTAYKSGHTPDDVYYSPERPVEEYVRVEKKDDRRYQSEEEFRDERYIRMKLRDRRWSSVLEDELYNSYSYNPYNRYYNNYISYSSPWNYYNYWNQFYNPYCTPYASNYNSKIGYYTPIYSTPVYNKPRNFNLFVFDANTNTKNPNIPKGNRAGNVSYPSSSENYRGSGSNAGDFLRNAFSSSSSNGNGSNSGSSSSSNTRTSTPVSSGNSSSSGSSESSRGNAKRGN